MKLKNTIDSIINQTIGFENIELIIVDDASKDKVTKELIVDYQLQYPYNIKPIFLEKNTGYPGKVRNIGLEYANSDYIIFSDHDDLYFNNGFEILYNAIIKYNSDMVMCNHYSNINGKKIKNKKYLSEKLINADPLDNQKNFNIFLHLNMSPWAKIFKKKFLINNNIKFLDDAYAEDVYPYIKILKYSKNITVLPDDYVYEYSIYEGSTIHTYSSKEIINVIKGWTYTNDLLKDITLNKNEILKMQVEVILASFCLVNNKIKKDLLLKIYNYEKKLKEEFNFDCKLKKKEIDILNKLVMQKKFKKAILLSNLYKTFYYNDFILRIYKKIRKNC